MEEEFFELERKWLIPFYDRFPIAITKGKYHYVFDTENKKYLDFTSGIGVVNFGHSNPAITKEVCRQLKRISHISNLYYNPLQWNVASLISQKSFKSKVFFCNSGAESNEAAIKVARWYGNSIRKGKNRIISLINSFHGRTMGAISITGQEKYRIGFEPLLENISFVNPQNPEELESKFDEDVCAIFLEAVQGEGGVYKLPYEFVKRARELCDRYNALMIFDEVQAGIGRTGKYFGYQNFDIIPDAITLAKALGNGIPIGALVLRNDVAENLPKGFHASTFGGNFVACSAAIKVLKLLDEKLLEKIRWLSKLFESYSKDLKDSFSDKIEEIRIYGLMIGIDFKEEINVRKIIDSLILKGILTLRAGKNVLRLLPPFTIGEKEIQYFYDSLKETLKNY